MMLEAAEGRREQPPDPGRMAWFPAGQTERQTNVKQRQQSVGCEIGYRLPPMMVGRKRCELWS